MGEHQMKHRISNVLGNNDTRFDLDNSGTIDKKVADLAIETYFSKWEGFDFKVTKSKVHIGIEPSYQYDPLCVLTIHRNKRRSTITTGRAFSHYGSGVRKRTLTYGDYVYKSKFVKFVDEAHRILFGSKEKA